jgi:putative GTP pyrophosphokinase
LAIPDILKRNFYRVAALLETADAEFVNIKEKLKVYEKSVSEAIKTTPEEVELNSASLESFITTDGRVAELDKKIAANNNYKIVDGSSDHLALLEKLYFLDIKTIKDLADGLAKNFEDILAFAKEWLIDGKGEAMNKGISVFYLCYVLVAKKNDPKLADQYFFNLVMKNFKKEQISSSGQSILETFKKSSTASRNIAASGSGE